eukprot:TRINITY_DN7285_c0_g1_i2.p1 TRINITY_DN7285_c0_g1~~TRINITY_DN7285_c0_g1_i2.p1  ORF type:complete len:246 (+),score=50.14 TRINITY_DN7285_c0_g1_i2:156-893(+)
MTPSFFDEIFKIFDDLDVDSDVKVVIIWAEGKVFTAGLDLKEAAGLLSGSSTSDPVEANVSLYKHIKSLQNAFDRIHTCKKPVIAAIHGNCVGGGVDLVTACDIRMCTQDAKFSVKETKLAIVADLGTLQRLPRLIGRGAAREMCFTGADYPSDWALRHHLVNEVFPDKDALLKAARSLALSIASNSPLVVQGTKVVLNYSDEHNLKDGLEHIALFNSAFLRSDDLQEAVMSFMEKRPPIFKSRL